MIERKFGGWIVMAQLGETVRHRRDEFEVALQWDEADPLAVKLISYEDDQEPNPWDFGRDLLYRAMVGRGLVIGRGDIKVKRELFKPNIVSLCVRVDDHHAHVELPADEVEAFLKETIDVCAVGEEILDDLVDTAIERILSS